MCYKMISCFMLSESDIKISERVRKKEGKNCTRTTYTTEAIVLIRIKMAMRINPIQTKDKKEILASRATFRYKHRGTTMNNVASKITTWRCANMLLSFIPVTLMRTFVTVSPTTTLYDTMAEKEKVNITKKFFSLPQNINIF